MYFAESDQSCFEKKSDMRPLVIMMKYENNYMRAVRKWIRANWDRGVFLTLSPLKAISTVTLGWWRPTGGDGSAFPSTRVTIPLQSTELCLMPLGWSRRCGKKHWLILLLRRSLLWGWNRDPLRPRLSSKMLFSSSANSFSEPTSWGGIRKLKTLVLLFRLDESRGPRKLRKD